jgi:hypothetical protein
MSGGTVTAEAEQSDLSLSDLQEDNTQRRAELDARLDRLEQQIRSRRTAADQTPAPTLLDNLAEATERAIRSVRSRLHEMGEELRRAEAEIAEDSRWSDEHKAQRIAELRSGAAAEAEAVAAQAWTRSQLAEQQLTEQLSDAERRINADINPVAVRALAEDYRSQMDLLDDGDRASRLRVVERLISQAEASGDPAQLRAVRVAVGPVLAQSRRSGPGDDDALSRDLLRRARGLLQIERAEADQIEQGLRAARTKRAELRFEIERLETQATGRRPSAFEPTPWQRRILGITLESNGGGIKDNTGGSWDSILGRK